MEKLSLHSITLLENDRVIMKYETLRQLLDYIHLQTSAINNLKAEVSSLKKQLELHGVTINNNSKNIKAVAAALEGAYKDE